MVTFNIDSFGNASGSCDTSGYVGGISFLHVFVAHYINNSDNRSLRVPPKGIPNNSIDQKYTAWFNSLGTMETLKDVLDTTVSSIRCPSELPAVKSTVNTIASEEKSIESTLAESGGPWYDIFTWIDDIFTDILYGAKTSHTVTRAFNKQYWNTNVQLDNFRIHSSNLYQQKYGTSVSTNKPIFVFKDLATAQKYIANDIPIMKSTDNKYFTWDVYDIKLPASVQNSIFTPNASMSATGVTENGTTNYETPATSSDQSFQGMFNSAIDACNGTQTNLSTNTEYLNTVANQNTYDTRLKNLRKSYHLEDASGNLYKSGQQPKQTQCYFGTSPWFDPEYYNSGLMTEAKNKCDNLSTVITQETVDCCANPWSLAQSGFEKCNITNTYPNNTYQGCNSGTTVPTSPSENIRLGQASQSFNVSSSDYEGFTSKKEGMTVQQETDAMNATCKTNYSIVENTLQQISSPAGSAAFANITSKLYPSGTDYSNVKSDVTQKGSNYLAYSTYTWPTDINVAMTTRSRISTKYDACTTGINDCSNNSSLVMLDGSSPLASNYLAATNPTEQCYDISNQYNTATNLCQHAYDMSVQFKDTNGEKILSQYITDISYGTLGRSMEETGNILTQAAHQCNEWVKMYDIYENDEERAAMIPCKPARSIANKFDAEINTIVSNWNTESSKYIAMLKAKLEVIQKYVEKYPNQTFDVSLVNVPNGTPNTPFVDMKPSGYDTSTPPNYTLVAYMPAGKPGPAGKSGQVGGVGPMGQDGSTGPAGPAGISEIPIQYTPFAPLDK
jgi:hypothetical protein